MGQIKEPITSIEMARVVLPTGLSQDSEQVSAMLKEVGEVMAKHLGSGGEQRIQGMHPDYRTGAKTYLIYFNLKKEG